MGLGTTFKIIERYENLNLVKFEDIEPGFYFKSTGNTKDKGEVCCFEILPDKFIRKGDLLDFYVKIYSATYDKNEGAPVIHANTCTKERHYLAFKGVLIENPFFISKKSNPLDKVFND